MTGSEAEAMARRYVELICRPGGLAAGMRELVSEDFVDHVSGQVGPGIWQVVEQWSEASFADAEATIAQIMTREDRVLIWFTVTARHVGNGFPRLRDLPVTGRKVSWEQVHLFRVADGRFVEHWALRDDYALVEALRGSNASPPVA